jgi:DDE superfamily endonuclease
MAGWHLPVQLVAWITRLSSPLHGRLAWRLLPLMTGMLFAQGRRTAASWFRAAHVGRDFRAYYYFLGSLGRKVNSVATLLLRLVVSVLAPSGDRLLFALDDTPTKRAGPLVEGAGIHHNPTPGPAEQKFLYGHVWVTLAWIVQHPRWGVIGLPLRALLYVRQKDLAKIAPWNRKHFPFRTKLELAAELVVWVATWLRFLGKTIWIVADGAYAKRPFLKAVLAAGVVLVSRLRKDAALWNLPTPPRRGQPCRRGRKPKYGQQAISLAKRAAHRRGWQQAEFVLYGQKVTKTFKTFLATYPVVGGVIRVVLVREDARWVAFFCTEPTATVEQVLEAVADRAVIEQDFHDVKEVHGAGQQQVRHIFANVAVFHLNLWLHTLIELWAWDQPAKKLRDRSASPWDNPERRPSHADRRNALRRECIRETFSAAGTLATLSRKSRALLQGLVKLIA